MTPRDEKTPARDKAGPDKATGATLAQRIVTAPILLEPDTARAKVADWLTGLPDSEERAVGALLEARAMGLSVPRDLSITGFDDIAISRQLDPPLTTMHVDNHEIGRRAADYLLACLKGERPAAMSPLVPILIRRGTTATPGLPVRPA